MENSNFLVPFPSAGSLKHTPNQRSSTSIKKTPVGSNTTLKQPVRAAVQVNINGVILFMTEATNEMGRRGPYKKSSCKIMVSTVEADKLSVEKNLLFVSAGGMTANRFAGLVKLMAFKPCTFLNLSWRDLGTPPMVTRIYNFEKESDLVLQNVPLLEFIPQITSVEVRVTVMTSFYIRFCKCSAGSNWLAREFADQCEVCHNSQWIWPTVDVFEAAQHCSMKMSDEHQTLLVQSITDGGMQINFIVSDSTFVGEGSLNEKSRIQVTLSKNVRKNEYFAWKMMDLGDASTDRETLEIESLVEKRQEEMEELGESETGDQIKSENP